MAGRRCARSSGSGRDRQEATPAHGAELALDEFVEFGQPHDTNLSSRGMAHPYRIIHLGNPARRGARRPR